MTELRGANGAIALIVGLTVQVDTPYHQETVRTPTVIQSLFLPITRVLPFNLPES